MLEPCQREHASHDRHVHQVGKLGEPLDRGGVGQVLQRERARAPIQRPQFGRGSGRTDSAHDRRGLLAKQLPEVRCGDDGLQAAVSGGVGRDRQRTDLRALHGEHGVGD